LARCTNSVTPAFKTALHIWLPPLHQQRNQIQSRQHNPRRQFPKTHKTIQKPTDRALTTMPLIQYQKQITTGRLRISRRR
jgi:hypothetical protein